MMEPWLAGFLIGFFGFMTAILKLHRTWEGNVLKGFLLTLRLLFWSFVFDFNLNYVIPAEISPVQSIAGRTGCFLGAAAACIWLDAPKGEKVYALLCVENWGKFIGLIAMILIGMTETALIFSNESLFIFWMIWTLGPSSDRKEEADHDFIRGVIICIAAIGISALWIWWHWESGGYAEAIYELNMIDMTVYMIYMLLSVSLFYGNLKKEEE